MLYALTCMQLGNLNGALNTSGGFTSGVLGELSRCVRKSISVTYHQSLIFEIITSRFSINDKLILALSRLFIYLEGYQLTEITFFNQTVRIVTHFEMLNTKTALQRYSLRKILTTKTTKQVFVADKDWNCLPFVDILMEKALHVSWHGNSIFLYKRLEEFSTLFSKLRIQNRAWYFSSWREATSVSKIFIEDAVKIEMQPAVHGIVAQTKLHHLQISKVEDVVLSLKQTNFLYS